ncbi:MAG: sigma-54 dependent transcriptional regulator, partial [Verrucomicrobiota bacterium]
ILEENLSDLNFATALLRDAGHDVVAIAKKEDAQKRVSSEQFELIIVEIGLLPIPNVDLISLAQREDSFIPVIVLTPESKVDEALMSMEMGVFTYMTKPIQMSAFHAAVEQAVKYHKIHAENAHLKNLIYTQYQNDSIIAVSPSMAHIPDLIAQAARSDESVLIEGKPGTGKEFVAKAVHTQSLRGQRNFVDINSKTIPHDRFDLELFGYTQTQNAPVVQPRTGKLEMANDGTLFIKEVALLSKAAQTKLLDFLRTRQILKHGVMQPIPLNVRLVASSGIPLEECIDRGEFDEELYDEMSRLTIRIPELHERTEDLPLLIQYFLKKHMNPQRQQIQCSAEALDVLKRYRWPGNIRELENVIWQFSIFIQKDRIEVDDIPQEIRNAVSTSTSPSAPVIPGLPEGGAISPLNEFTRRQESAYIMRVIEQLDGDKMKAANALNISLTTLYRKLDAAGDGAATVTDKAALEDSREEK